MAFIDTEQRPAGEVQQKVGRLRLSEAIRIGARLRPQCQGDYFHEGMSCALGAAWEGAGFKGRPSPSMIEILYRFGINLPQLAWQIVSKNDSGESRESIADWLAEQGL